MKSLSKYLLWMVIFLCITGVAVSYAFYRYLTTSAFYAEASILVEIKPGTHFSELARYLEGQNVIRKPKWWTAYAVATGQAEKVKAGEYQIQPGSSPLQILDMFLNGRVVVYQLTLVEGWRFVDVLNKLAQQEKLVHLSAGLSPQEVMVLLGKPGEHPEGRFFPDSYQYVAGNSDIDILKRAYARLEQVLTEEWHQRADNLPYETPYEALIMASIVEKETGVADEREQIAGVFVRRLQKGMRLQTDPTVIYGLGDAYQGNLQRQHLAQKTRYNTYLIKGLPPTPIAMAGRAAIQAALHPASGSSLYFVARGDGSHFFSDTLTEHTKAVQQFQIKQRTKQYQSSPKIEAK